MKDSKNEYDIPGKETPTARKEVLTAVLLGLFIPLFLILCLCFAQELDNLDPIYQLLLVVIIGALFIARFVIKQLDK